MPILPLCFPFLPAYFDIFFVPKHPGSSYRDGSHVIFKTPLKALPKKKCSSHSRAYSIEYSPLVDSLTAVVRQHLDGMDGPLLPT